MKHYLTVAALAALVFLNPLAARAQDVPSYAQPSGDDVQIRGRIASFDGAYALSVRDDHGYLDNVQLHNGTIINPTGLTLEPGMVVSILGYNSGSYVDANEVDTPYNFVAGVPYYAGHPWGYYGPSFSLGFFFGGGGGWWHGDYFHGPYHYNAGVRVYDNVHVRQVYRGTPGSFHGHAYVAAREHGGYYPHAGGHGGPHR